MAKGKKGVGGIATGFLSDDRPKKQGPMSRSEYDRRSSTKNVKFSGKSTKFKKKQSKGF